jgi:hypothetical protein
MIMDTIYWIHLTHPVWLEHYLIAPRWCEHCRMKIWGRGEGEAEVLERSGGGRYIQIRGFRK